MDKSTRIKQYQKFFAKMGLPTPLDADGDIMLTIEGVQIDFVVMEDNPDHLIMMVRGVQTILGARNTLKALMTMDKLNNAQFVCFSMGDSYESVTARIDTYGTPESLGAVLPTMVQILAGSVITFRNDFANSEQLNVAVNSLIYMADNNLM